MTGTRYGPSFVTMMAKAPDHPDFKAALEAHTAAHKAYEEARRAFLEADRAAGEADAELRAVFARLTGEVSEDEGRG